MDTDTTPHLRRRPHVDDLAALTDDSGDLTASGYVVSDVDEAHGPDDVRWVWLRRTANRAFLVKVRADQSGQWPLNGRPLTFVTPDHRSCELCGQLFAPDPFADPEVCYECQEDVVEVQP